MSNTLEFFNHSMGRHLVKQTGNPLADANRALGSGHAMADKPIAQRIASGWAIVRESDTTMQFKLAARGLRYSTETRYEAWLAALESFDGSPVIFVEFAKKPVPASNMTRTFDLRAVSICTPVGVDTFDWTVEPGPMASKNQRALWNLKAKMAKEAEKSFG
jgi:hypothetical protein